MNKTLRSGLVAAATLVATLAFSGLALAHTGHGHAELSTFEGLVHALGEPDHLAMLAAGLVVTAVLAPLVRRGIAALRSRTRARRTQAAVTGAAPGAQA